MEFYIENKSGLTVTKTRANPQKSIQHIHHDAKAVIFKAGQKVTPILGRSWVEGVRFSPDAHNQDIKKCG